MMIKNNLDIFYLAIIETCIAGRKVGSQSCKSDTGWVRRSIWNLSITGSIWWILFGFYALKNVEISSFKTISIQTAEGRNFPRLIMMEKDYNNEPVHNEEEEATEYWKEEREEEKAKTVEPGPTAHEQPWVLISWIAQIQSCDSAKRNQGYYWTHECLGLLCLNFNVDFHWYYFSPVIREIQMRGAVQKPTKYWGTKQSQFGDEKSGNLSPSKQYWLVNNQDSFLIGNGPNCIEHVS